MKKLLIAAVCLATMGGFFAGCSDNDGTEDAKNPAAPSIALNGGGGNIDQTQELTDGMSLKVNVTAEGKIQDLTVSISSSFLTEEMLNTVGLGTSFSLANPASAELAAGLAELGFPVGERLIGQTSLQIDISQFVPLIMAYNRTSDHKFTLAVTDAKGQHATKTLTLHLTGRGAPTIVLVDGDIDRTQEIEESMSVRISVEAPGAIAGFTVRIDSPALTPEILAAVGLAQTLDLVNPGEMAAGLTELKFPVGDAVSGQTAVSFDISTLVPLIARIYTQTSDHKFTLTVTDAKEQTTAKVLTFHLTGASAISYNDDADLWANTATVTAENLPEGATVQYRVKNAEKWTDAMLVEGSTWRLAPAWNASKNDAKLDIYTIEPGTGIFAGTTYEYRIVEGAGEGRALASGSFTTAAGDVIPNGDMSGWSKKEITMSGKVYPITYPNAENQHFWDSGNNMFLEQYDETGKPKLYTPLCAPSEDGGAACLKAQKVLGSVFASGNMFTGKFEYAGMSGTAHFGQPYVWTARPKTLKLRYKAKVGVIDKLGSYDPDKDSYEGKQDRSCVFVAVVNWASQHGVTSGVTQPSGMWNPADAKSFDEGAVLGYGQRIITESTDGWVELTIPVQWYDKEAANPSSAKFSLVISCATSVRGDYLTGCSTNEMFVDDFQWVY